ncbi:hypothetical protein TB2_032314 [Malus domestica]
MHEHYLLTKVLRSSQPSPAPMLNLNTAIVITSKLSPNNIVFNTCLVCNLYNTKTYQKTLQCPNRKQGKDGAYDEHEHADELPLGQGGYNLIQRLANESTAMYILALLLLFVLAFAMETLSAWPNVKPSMNPIVAGLAQASVYAVRIGMGYLVMLAVMSFNARIFIVAVAGHTFGYFIVKAITLAVAKPAASPP